MQVRYTQSALRALVKCNKRDLIEAKIDDMSTRPLAENRNVKRLRGRPEYRLRVQDWRVIFAVDGTILEIRQIKPRGSAY